MVIKNQEAMVNPQASSRALWLKRVRQLHLYLGVFFAPAILFFSFSGTLQLFSLQDARPGGAYQPPKWILMLAAIHKKQVVIERQGPPRDFNAGPKQEPARPEQERPPQARREQPPALATYALKWFFVLMSLGLMATTLLGIYMAFTYNRNRAVVWSLLAAGVAIPAWLIALLA